MRRFYYYLLLCSIIFSLSACRQYNKKRYNTVFSITQLKIKNEDGFVDGKNIGDLITEQDLIKGISLKSNEIEKQIEKYNKKYKINAYVAHNSQEFLNILDTFQLNSVPKAIFQYNDGHKYGAIFVKYNDIDYCIFVDTIPHLSAYTKNLIQRNGDLYIKFNNKEYKVIMFGENLQKSNKGCGSFTLVFLKHLLKNNAKMLYKVIDVANKYSTEDKTVRDVNKKSCIRGVKFDIIKQQDFAPEIYKYSQNIDLQKEFDGRMLYHKKDSISLTQYFASLGNCKLSRVKRIVECLSSIDNKNIDISDVLSNSFSDIKFSDYRKRYSIETNVGDKKKELSTKIVLVTLKYRYT